MQQRLRNQPLWAGFYLGWIVLLIWLSVASMPSPLHLGFALEDKVKHALAYAVLAFFGERTWRGLPLVKRSWLWSLSVALFFGAVMELVQGYFTLVRVPDWRDWLADGIGAGLTLWIDGMIRYKKRRQAS